MQFFVHERLVANTHEIGSLPLCEVLLMDDNRFPWVILVPRIPNLLDFHEIPAHQRDPLFAEIEIVSKGIQHLWSVDKLNVAALGNQVPQLHVHVIGRRKTDDAWPNPVWGKGSRHPYSTEQRQTTLQSLITELHLSE